MSRERVQAEIDRIVGKIKEEKTILGHSSLAMTMDLYSHVLPDTRAEEMEKIASVL